MRLCSVSLAMAVILTAPLLAFGEDGMIHLTLSGDWSGAAPDGTEISYSFSREGAVVWRVKEKQFMRTFPEGLQGKYQLRVGKPVCEIDIYDFTDPRFKDIRFRGIVEIIDGKSFKMEGRPSNQGDRPKEFGKEAIVFSAKKK